MLKINRRKIRKKKIRWPKNVNVTRILGYALNQKSLPYNRELADPELLKGLLYVRSMTLPLNE